MILTTIQKTPMLKAGVFRRHVTRLFFKCNICGREPSTDTRNHPITEELRVGCAGCRISKMIVPPYVFIV
jgi:hypothetical protein